MSNKKMQQFATVCHYSPRLSIWKQMCYHFPGDIKMKERTFIAIKPDGVQRGLIGRVIGRIEDKGYKIIGLKMLSVTKMMVSYWEACLATIRSSCV